MKVLVADAVPAGSWHAGRGEADANGRTSGTTALVATCLTEVSPNFFLIFVCDAVVTFLSVEIVDMVMSLPEHPPPALPERWGRGRRLDRDHRR